MTDTAVNNVESPQDKDLPQQLLEVESLLEELNRLLGRHSDVLDQEGIKKHAELLERWMDSYRHGLAAANKISETGKDWLTEMHDKLKLAADEQLRLEGEGGNPATREQAEKTEEMIKTVRRIEKILPNIEHLFCTQTQDAHEPA